MTRISENYIKEFCSVCDNFSEESLECSVLNGTYREKYLEAGSCSEARINGVPVMVLNKDRVCISGEWYDRSDESGIVSALTEKKKKRLEPEPEFH